MPHDPSYVHPLPLDPLGALLYYLAVTRAIGTGGLLLPSSQFLADELAFHDVNGGQRALNERVQTLWEDLVWMDEEHLLFNEEPQPPTAFFRTLSQHNVNQRVRHFPGIEHAQRRRRLRISHTVEKAGTAARLTALKDLYRFNLRELPQTVLREFLLDEKLVSNPDEVYSFLESMCIVEFIEIFPTGDWVPTRDRDKHFYVEPTDTFRSLDMYLELRGLDFLHDEHSSFADRRRRRLQRHERAHVFSTGLRT